MKTLKTALIATLAAVLLIALCGTAMSAHASELPTSKKQGLITGLNQCRDCTEYTVTMMDGARLAFYADNNSFQIGDLVWLDVFYGNQPEVLEACWIETLDWDGIFRWLDRVYG